MASEPVLLGCIRIQYCYIVIIAIAMFRNINLDELWLSFGTGSNLRHIPIHEIVQEMDHRVSSALPMFHALTGECKKGCTRWCKCVKASLKCAALCHCGGEC